MKPLHSLVLLAGLATLPASATTPVLKVEPRVLTTCLDGELTIDPAGAVESFRVTTGVSPGMASKVESMVRNLRFEPVNANGQPARAHTVMRVTLAGVPSDNGGLDVWLDNVVFPKSEKNSPDHERAPGLWMKVDGKSMPQYPLSAARLGVDADVLLVVKVSRDGHIADAAVRQSALIAAGGEPEAVATLLSDFENQSLRTIRRWHVAVKIADGANPTDEQMTALVPFIYRMQERPSPHPGDWVWETRSEKREAPWLPPDPGKPMVGVADFSGGEMMPPQGDFRLASKLPARAL